MPQVNLPRQNLLELKHRQNSYLKIGDSHLHSDKGFGDVIQEYH